MKKIQGQVTGSGQCCDVTPSSHSD